MFRYAYKFQSEEGSGIILLRDLDPATVQDRTKCPGLITNVLLQLVRDIINGVCYQRCENVLSNRKVVHFGPSVDFCPAEKNMEEEL